MNLSSVVVRGSAGVLAAGAVALAALPTLSAADIDPLAVGQALEQFRLSGDAVAERAHVWALLADITGNTASEGALKPLFETWHGEGELFGSPAPVHPATGIAGFYRTDSGRPALDPPPDVPVLTYTLYNGPAFSHIVDNHLNETPGLDVFLKTGAADLAVPGDRSVPQFPTSAIVMKTVWWPVAGTGITAMPVWDPAENPALGHGNAYTTWQRVVGVDPNGAKDSSTVAASFMGSSFPTAHRVSLDALYHVPVDADLARRVMADPPSAKAMLIALGRPLQAGDYLALVGINLATREIPEWVWATAWWHDQPDEGPFAEGRPASLAGPWANYLMQAAFDTVLPAAADGGPHIAFNPWLEGRFPDGGAGSGVTSNCMACHERASYPAVAFLPVTRGESDTQGDKAFAPGRLRTSLLWSLAMHAKS